MARKGHVLHVPEDYSEKDMSRPLFDRPSGRVGIYVELGDAVPIDPHEFGSHIYFLRETEDKLDQAIRQVSLHKVKGVFERRFLFNDVIFEGYHDNRIISVSFEDATAIETLHQQYQQDLVSSCLQDALVSPGLLSAVGVRSLTLECRIWEDELDDCLADIQQGRVAKVKLENSKHDQALIKGIKRYMPTLAEHLMLLKDNLNQFDKILGEFIMILKQKLPKSVEQINTYEELMEHIETIKQGKSDAKQGRVLGVYTKVRDNIIKTLEEFEDHVMHPLLQVHADCEIPFQRDLKSKMRSSLRETKSHLESDYDFYNLNHKEWQAKVLHNEQKLFLGMISVLPKSVGVIIDADVYTDEYLSALTVKIRP